jgi:hypothetical protein
MATAADFANSLTAIVDRIGDDASERDVENAFLTEDFYSLLGYDGTGHDLRSEWTLPDNRRPDFVTLDENESVTAVYEFKTSGRDLTPHTDQLFHYVDSLKADYGVLTNGEELRLYRRGEQSPLTVVSLGSVTESDAENIRSALRKPEWDITDPDSVSAFLDQLDPVSLDTELGREHFFDTFRLEAGSPFADLVTAEMDLLHELRDEQEKPFVEGAYEFWETSYASDPEEVPDSWEPFIGEDHSLMDFMFCLESGHALLSRLLLAKATDDNDFFRTPVTRRFFENIQGYGEEIRVDVYPAGASDFLTTMRDELVESLFEDDIFVWWIDGYGEALDTGHGSADNRFRDILRGETEVTAIDPATKERFSRAIAHVLYSIMRFDFSAIEGDPLGDLYQQYFDPETRKALGEFYTPQPVVEYIMDGVGYDTGVSNERLIDPSCGSGTFLVEAVERYLDDVRRFHEDPDWERHLTELCTRPRIVGLDIHPFAVLMAQIRFIVAILPEYRQAKRANQDFTIRRLPIFRTDSLRNERKSTGEDLGDDGGRQLTLGAVTEDNQDVRIPVPLPVEAKENEETEEDSDFLIRRVRMPLFDTIQLETGVSNFGEYFAALQGVLDVVKAHMSEGMWEYHGGLERGINRYTSRDYEGVEDFFTPYVNDMLENVRYLQDVHNDGRLFKMFEDTVLALVVKNYLDYEYVVGNPPYVRIQNLPDHQKRYLDEIYESTTGNYDLYCPFYERGLDWLTEGSGRLGYITPNQFLVTDYAEGLRRVLLDKAAIEEVYDFRDSGVFEDAKNYPAIVILRDEADPELRYQNKIRCVRVKADTKKPTDRDLDTAVLEAVREQRDNPGYDDDLITVFDYPQSDLGDGYWSLMPPEELNIVHKMESVGDSTVGEVTDSVFAGTQTSANKVFLLTPVNANRISAEDAGQTVKVVPKGTDREYEIETDTLRPWLQGRDVHRWRGDWSGEHAIVPYVIERDDEGNLTYDLINKEKLQNELPLTWNYLTDHRDQLEDREGGRFRGREDWYAFGYPKSMTRFEDPKLIGSEIAAESTFMLDDEGTWYFKAAYGVQLEDDYKDRTDTLAALLNSNALDFYIKHYTTLKVDGFYKYTTNYLTPLPVAWGEKSDREEIRNHVSTVTDVLNTAGKAERFPEAYLGGFDGELDYITYEWQTRRYPVNAEIQGEVDGQFAVQAGRSDEITDAAMYAEERSARKRRAEYVREAVDGRNVKSGETTTIPIPRTDTGVEALLDTLRADEMRVREADIDALEEQVNQLVYHMFDITPDEQEVIEDYLNTFRVY